MAVSKLDIYKIVVDPTQDATSKRQAIDMLYGVPPPDYAAGPDLRVASIKDLPAAATKMGADPSSVVMAAQAAGETEANDAIRRKLLPSEAISHEAPPATVAAAPAPSAAPATAAAPAPAPSPGGATAPRPRTDQEASDLAAGAIIENYLRGTPRQHIAAHDQATGSVVEQKDPIPEELKTAIGINALHSGARSIEQGEHEAKVHVDAAIAADLRQKDLEKERADLAAKRKYQEEHAAKLDAGFEQLAKDTAVTPGSWWESKDTGQKILSVISAVMLGLAKKPEALQEIIDKDVASRQINRDKFLGARKSAIDNFRSQMMSPEAANAADRALAAQAAAAEATRLAEAAKAPEARDKALQIAAEQQAQFNRFMAEMAMHEAKSVRTNIAHVAAHDVGGPGSLAGAVKLGKGLGLEPEGVLRKIGGGHYTAADSMPKDQREAANDKVSRTVVFPGGVRLYGRTSGEAIARQKAIDSAREILHAYDQLDKLGAKAGHSIAPTDVARIETIISRNLLNLKNSEELGAISATDMALINPLSGGSTGDVFAYDASNRTRLEQARTSLLDKLNVGKQSLFAKPWDNAETGGAAAETVELP